MAPITESMIRRRAEHNDGVLETLEELVLQEEGIDKIDTLGRLCPNLKQLYMPNNLIPRIENMHRLKSLEYLNLALNNVVKVEGLHGCEVLKKLDLTLNFVHKEDLCTVLNLQANIHLAELFLTGNPCTDFPNYRKFVIAAVPSLKRLDAIVIKPSERIAAQQIARYVGDRASPFEGLAVIPTTREDIVHLEVYRMSDKSREFCELQKEILKSRSNATATADANKEEPEHPEAVDEKGHKLREYSAATRLAEHQEMQDLRAEAEKTSNEKTNSKEHKSKRRKGFDPLPTNARIYQKNEGGWDFKLTESDCGELVLLDVAVGRYLDTSLIDVDIHPSLIRVLIKGKLLQLKLPSEVKSDESRAQRSTTTGHLLLTCPKVVPDALRRPYYYCNTNNRTDSYEPGAPQATASDLPPPHLKPKKATRKGDETVAAHGKKSNINRDEFELPSAPAANKNTNKIRTEDAPQMIGSDVVDIRHIVDHQDPAAPSQMKPSKTKPQTQQTDTSTPYEDDSEQYMSPWDNDDVPPPLE